MSRKITPGLGKSITGRIRDLMSNESKIIVEESWGKRTRSVPAACRLARPAVRSTSSVAAGQGAQLDRVEDVHFLAFGFEQFVLLEAGEHAGHGFHRQAQVVADFVARHAQAELVGREATGTEARRQVDQEGGDALVGGFLRQQQHHLLIVADLAAHHAHQLAAQLRQLQRPGRPGARRESRTPRSVSRAWADTG